MTAPARRSSSRRSRPETPSHHPRSLKKVQLGNSLQLDSSAVRPREQRARAGTRPVCASACASVFATVCASVFAWTRLVERDTAAGKRRPKREMAQAGFLQQVSLSLSLSLAWCARERPKSASAQTLESVCEISARLLRGTLVRGLASSPRCARRRRSARESPPPP